MSESFAVRFWGNVRKENAGECWEWLAGKSGAGYGVIRDGRKVLGAHRVSYEFAFGKIPEGLIVCHHCDNPGCVNPGLTYRRCHE